MKTVLLTSLLLLTAMAGCNKKRTQLQAFMDHADQFALFEIDQFATPVNEQAADREYLSDYEIFKPLELSKSAMEELKKVLSDSLTYTQENVKTCPFIGKYGLSVTNKKSAYIHFIISTENCPKCQVFASDRELEGSFDIVNLDLFKILEKD